MTFHPVCAAKLSLQLFLFAVCLSQFGLPSVHKYRQQETILTTRDEEQQDIAAPAVRICPLNPHNAEVGFKSNDSFPGNTGDALQYFCPKDVDTTSCIEEKTYKKTDAVIDVTKGPLPNAESFLDPSLWITELFVPSYGKCFTLNTTSFIMDTDFTIGALRLILNNDLSYHIFIHDFDYFAMNGNPHGVPNNYMTLRKDHGAKYYKMRVVRRRNIKNCQPNPHYKFTSCLVTSVSLKVGCRQPWDVWTAGNMSNCSTLDQFR